MKPQPAVKLAGVTLSSAPSSTTTRTYAVYRSTANKALCPLFGIGTFPSLQTTSASACPQIPACNSSLSLRPRKFSHVFNHLRCNTHIFVSFFNRWHLLPQLFLPRRSLSSENYAAFHAAARLRYERAHAFVQQVAARFTPTIPVAEQPPLGVPQPLLETRCSSV